VRFVRRRNTERSFEAADYSEAVDKESVWVAAEMAWKVGESTDYNDQEIKRAGSRPSGKGPAD